MKKSICFFLFVVLLLLITTVAQGSASESSYDPEGTVPYNKLRFELDYERLEAINESYTVSQIRCKDRDSFNTEYAAWIALQERFKKDNYVIWIFPDAAKFLTDEEIAVGFVPWASGNELKSEEICKRAYPEIIAEIESYTTEYGPDAGHLAALIDKEKITPQKLEQLLSMDIVRDVLILRYPTSIDDDSIESRTIPSTFMKVAIISGIVIGTAAAVTAVLLIIHYKKKQRKLPS